MSADRRGNGSEPPESLSAGAREAMHEEEALGRAYDVRLLRRLWRYVAPYKPLVATTLLLVGPLFVLDAAPAWIIKTGLDRVVGNGAADVEMKSAPGSA